MRYAQTKKQIKANALDLEMYRLADRLEAFAEEFRHPEIYDIAHKLRIERSGVRALMHPKDREETS